MHVEAFEWLGVALSAPFQSVEDFFRLGGWGEPACFGDALNGISGAGERPAMEGWAGAGKDRRRRAREGGTC